MHDAAFFQIQLRFTALTPPADDDTGLAYFAGIIDTGESQRVRYARLTSGITFELEEGRDAVLDRWERQIEHLRQAASGAAAR